jgi:hypothetical protein
METVSYTFETLPPVSKEEWERIDTIKDEDNNYSDIPKMKDLSGLRPRQVRELNTKQERYLSPAIWMPILWSGSNGTETVLKIV